MSGAIDLLIDTESNDEDYQPEKSTTSQSESYSDTDDLRDATSSKRSNSSGQEFKTPCNQTFLNRPDLISVCSVCLDTKSDDINEIIFCDKCGYAVHEACYGVEKFYNKEDGNTIGERPVSVESDDPTELWFCERCTSGETVPMACELCPNKGNVGMFKRTDERRWTHLVCAICTPGVSFYDTDKLWPVCLSEMPQNLFGRKVCSLCTDRRYSRTGVCVTCEAGLCNVSAHAGCAYLQGLLSVDESNPGGKVSFVFHCKQHCNPDSVNERLSLLKFCEQFAQRVRHRQFTTSEEQKRSDRLFLTNKRHYDIRNRHFDNENPESWTKPRPLMSSALFIQMMLYKENQIIKSKQNADCDDEGGVGGQLNLAENNSLTSSSTDSDCDSLTIDEDSSSMDDDSVAFDTDQVPISGGPCFSSKFIRYYKERERQIIKNLDRKTKLDIHLSELKMKENDIVDVLEQFSEVRSKCKATVVFCRRIYSLLSELASDPNDSSRATLSTCTNRPNESVTHEKDDHGNHHSWDSITTGQFEQLIDKIPRCSVCELMSHQDSLIKCHACSSTYHLQCLDPPLTELPLKILEHPCYSWQCSWCTAGVGYNSSPDIITRSTQSSSCDKHSSQDSAAIIPRSNTSTKRLNKTSNSESGDNATDDNTTKSTNEQTCEETLQTNETASNKQCASFKNRNKRHSKPSIPTVQRIKRARKTPSRFRNYS